LLREGLIAQLRAAGGSVAAFADDEVDEKIDYVFVDAGTSAVPDPRALPDSDIPSFVLLAPAAHGKLGELIEMGFAGHIAKPIRQDSLIETFAAQLQVVPDAAHVAVSAPVQPQANPSRGFKVLLAEDNPVNALLTRELLRRRGHTVREVVTGDGAVKAMNEERFDLVLTDIHMPGMDGIEATKAIRADELTYGRARTPIIALTADAMETGKRACKDAGMDGFLTKPVDPALLDQMFETFFPPGAQTAAA
jgi:CheY-like chemotaxis protein